MKNFVFHKLNYLARSNLPGGFCFTKYTHRTVPNKDLFKDLLLKNIICYLKLDL
jgi:hypothetical protein